MSKRLLFVDDESMVLDGLRRALHPMRSEWEMTFVGGAAPALEALDREHFDAIITDMRMPGIDGAQLLELVKERNGDIVRIVLSGQSEKESVLRSIAPAHQFLSKPCNLEELKSRLSQAFAMRDLLRNPSLAAIVSRLRSIPSLPTLYNELTAALASENTSLVQIERIITKDVGMAAKILQLANSAFIGARTHVSSISHALSLIGAEIIRSLTLSIHVFSQFDRHSDVASYIPALWDHSMAVAWLAQRIALAETGRKALAEESFTTGLLHDIGKIVLLAEMPQEYRQLIRNVSLASRSYHDLEVECINCSHEQIGAYLMSIWGLPETIIHAVEFHHHPSQFGQNGFSALTAVHCADAIASSVDPSPLNRDIQLDRAHLEALGLSSKEPIWRTTFDEYLLAKSSH